MIYKIYQNKKVYPIPGFPYYYISKSGDVWSEKSYKFLKPVKCTKYGHLLTTLHKNHIGCTKYIHRLVLETFVGPCSGDTECCHNDGDPANNRLENLRWDTSSNNRKDAYKHGTAAIPDNRGEKQGRSKLNSLQVRIIRQLLALNSLKQIEIAKLFNVSLESISGIKLRRTWRHI